MAQTSIARGSTLSVKKQGVLLMVDSPKKSFWDRFEGEGEGTMQPSMVLTELASDKDAGDYVDFQLVAQSTAAPTEGENPHSGREEGIVMHTCGVYIDQLTHGVDCGYKMTRKRTRHNLRETVRRMEGPYWGTINDEMSFMYASGSRGDNTNWKLPLSYTGFAGNSLSAPDSYHLRKAGGKAYSAMGTGDVLTTTELNTVKTLVDMLGGDVNGVPAMEPTEANGVECYVYVMNKYSENDLKSAAGTGGWLDIQKAIAANVGEKTGICTGALGWFNGMVLHSHQKAIRFNSGTSIGGVAAATGVGRNLVLGKQAITKSYGTKANKGIRFGWTETYEDRGRRLVVDTDTIVGYIKNTFNSLDLSVFAHDVAANAPT